VSVFLVDLVLKARMPIDMQSRSAKKLVLVMIAKVCQNDEGLDCFPSRSTLARAAERSERTIDGFLMDLRSRGFITETDSPRRHRPRTWRLNVDRLLDLQHAASLEPKEDRQHVASLERNTAVVTGDQDRQSRPVDSQFQAQDSQQDATERNERSEQSEEIPDADASVFPLSKDDRKRDIRQLDTLYAIADEVVRRDPMLDWHPLFATAETEARARGLTFDHNQLGVALLKAKNRVTIRRVHSRGPHAGRSHGARSIR
jgi:hypothetical protein